MHEKDQRGGEKKLYSFISYQNKVSRAKKEKKICLLYSSSLSQLISSRKAKSKGLTTTAVARDEGLFDLASLSTLVRRRKITL